jgi:hypothetical protein
METEAGQVSRRQHSHEAPSEVWQARAATIKKRKLRQRGYEDMSEHSFEETYSMLSTCVSH